MKNKKRGSLIQNKVNDKTLEFLSLVFGWNKETSETFRRVTAKHKTFNFYADELSNKNWVIKSENNCLTIIAASLDYKQQAKNLTDCLRLLK